MPAFIQTPFLPLQRFSLRRCVRPPVPVHRRSHRRPVVSPPFSVPIASADDTLVLTEENVVQALNEVRVKLGSVFGNSAENRGVGITGDVSLSELDGPIVVLSLKGRFWHKRADVLARVSSFLMQRIPEICDVSIEDVRQLDDSEENSAV